MSEEQKPASPEAKPDAPQVPQPKKLTTSLPLPFSNVVSAKPGAVQPTPTAPTSAEKHAEISAGTSTSWASQPNTHEDLSEESKSQSQTAGEAAAEQAAKLPKKPVVNPWKKPEKAEITCLNYPSSIVVVLLCCFPS